MFEIIVSKYGGYCFGVERAIQKLLNSRKTSESGMYTYGPIIHNNQIEKKIEEKDIHLINNAEEAPENSTVFIRTHGVPLNVINTLKKKNVNIIDLTCPYVKKIQGIVSEHDNVIIVGDINHPEVEGIIGNCKKNFFVLKTKDELKDLLNKEKNTDFTLVAQTTFNFTLWTEMQEFVKTLSNVTVYDTICKATFDRQNETESMAKACDLMIIVGGKHSSNTKKLYEIAIKYCEAIHIENFNELPNNLSKYKKIGLSAGASTPLSAIEEVINNMVNENDVKNLPEEQDIDFAEELEASLKVIRTGQRVKGIICVISGNEIQLDMGGKHSGYIPMSEFSEEEQKELKIGDEVDATVIKVSDVEGTVLLSKKKLDSIKGFEKIEKAKDSNEILSGKVVEIVKGGIIVLVNAIRAFVPASLASLRRDTNLEEMLNKIVRLRIIEVENGRRKRIIGSIKSVLKDEKEASEKTIWANIEEGKKFKGIVKSLASFGAFVDIGGVDGLIHISDLSWSKIKHPSEVLKEGDVVEVEVKKFDPEEHRISLDYKKVEENPWEILKVTHNVGDIIDVKVLKMMPYGTFVSVIPGIDGLVHISQIANRHINKVSDVLKVGEIVKAKITEINYDTQKISLSIKACLEPDENTISDETTIEK